MPLKARATALSSKNSLKKREIMKIITKDGKQTPRVEKAEPQTPAFL